MKKVINNTFIRLLCILLIALMLIPALPALAESVRAATPGVPFSGVLKSGDDYHIFNMAKLTSEQTLGVRLTISPSRNDYYEVALAEYRNGEVMNVVHLDSENNEDCENVTFANNTLTYETPRSAYSAGDYRWEISCPDYQFSDNNDGEITYSELELNFTFEILAVSPKPGVSRFTDVKSSDWFYEDVAYAFENGLFQGTSDTTFSPNNNMSRGMFVTVLGRSAGIDEEAYRSFSFSDVPVGEYYAPHVNWAYGIGVVNGAGGGKFGPNEPIRRQDLVTMLYRYVAHIGGDTSVGDTSVGDTGAYTRFSDRALVSDYAVAPFQWAVSRRIISGMSATELSPTTYATRAQVAKIFRVAEEFLQPVETPEPTLDADVKSVESAYEATLKNLVDGTREVEVSEVVAALYADALRLEEDGLIKNLEICEDAILYEYEDGVPGGIYIDLPVFEDSAEAEEFELSPLDEVPEQAETPMLFEQGEQAENVIGSKKVLFGASFPIVDENLPPELLPRHSFSEMIKQMSESGHGFEVTQNDGMKLRDLKMLNNYGIIFLSFPGTIRGTGNDPIVLLDESYSAEKNDYINEVNNGVAGIYTFFSPNDLNVSSSHQVTHVLTMKSYSLKTVFGININKFFRNFYGSASANSFPDSIVHLGYTNSLNNPDVPSLLQGAACVTGFYGQTTREGLDYDMVSFMVDQLLSDDGTGKAGRRLNQISPILIVNSALTEWQGTGFAYTTGENWEVGPKIVLAHAAMKYPDSKRELRAWVKEAPRPIDPGDILTKEDIANYLRGVSYVTSIEPSSIPFTAFVVYYYYQGDRLPPDYITYTGVRIDEYSSAEEARQNMPKVIEQYKIFTVNNLVISSASASGDLYRMLEPIITFPKY